MIRLSRTARVLIVGQAPGARVHASGLPFDDRSGDRLRAWMGIGREVFYDTTLLAIVPMAFCFPGYDARGSDLPPPKICAETWRAPVMETLSQIELTLLIGQYAQAWHLGRARGRSLTETVRNWRAFTPTTLPLPHPSWRNTGWLKKNPWFDAEVLPWLRARVSQLCS
ncbi:MAG: uracil-DNA glycosylase family protein [Pseudomonadota bacterium]